jgi:prolyl-tRNA editing enzyme YbaK/EbsC (Cys-tRNA(Pro) deacylase)
MATKHLQALASKAINDSAFRALLARDPEAALKTLKIRPDKSKIAALRKMPHRDLQKLARAFGHKSRSLIN